MPDAVRWHTPMRPRRSEEPHRAATPLELFFDLCFVVAIAQAASGLHHALVESHYADALVGFGTVFFAIWWAWMNFTWYASAYDTDDVAYRLATLVQIAGALIIAAGVPRAFADQDFGIVVLGYVIMRTALVAQWLRASAADPVARPGTLRYAVGVSVCQVGWIGLLAVPDVGRTAGFAALVVAELLVPVWAERAGRTSWHPRHIAERYGLFTIIVLGESVLAATVAFQQALDGGTGVTDLATVGVGALLVVFAMWWMYFDQPADRAMERARAAFVDSTRASFVWGYGHLAVFASAAAVGAGLEVAVDHAVHPEEVSATLASGAVAVPVALYLLSIWLLHARLKEPGPLRTTVPPVGAVVVLATIPLGLPVLPVGIALGAAIAVSVAAHSRPAAAEPAEPTPAVSSGD
jgi:low temperature requirement protein LtrA